MNRWGPLAILVIAAVAAAIGVLTSADHEKHGPAQLVIHERALKSNETFTEGAVGFLTVRRTSDDDVVFHGRYGYRLSHGLPFAKIPIELARHLPPGHYRLVSYVRSCAGSCASLDRFQSDRCEEPVELQRGQRLDVTLFTVQTQPCRFHVQ